MKKTMTKRAAPPSTLWNGKRAICTYCDKPADLTQYGDPLYPYRRDFGQLWACMCGAYVGCHPGTDLPLGRMANRELREAKKAAHAAFDPLWKAESATEGSRRHKSRTAAYGWLAEQLGIPADECHIGWFDIEQCQRVIEVCTPHHKGPRHEQAQQATPAEARA